MLNHFMGSSVKWSACAIFAFAVLVFGKWALFAHGVSWEESEKKAYGLEFAYDDESVMGFAEAKVYGPDDPANLYQVGRTTEDGYFAFIPSKDGKWLVTADDASGHLSRAELDIKSVAAGGDAAAAGEAAAAFPGTSKQAIERAAASAAKPYKMAAVILVMIVLGLGWKVFGAQKTSTGKACETGDSVKS